MKSGLVRKRIRMVSSSSGAIVFLYHLLVLLCLFCRSLSMHRWQNEKNVDSTPRHGSPCAPRWPRNCGLPCGAARGRGQPRRRAIPTPRCRATVAARVPPGGERDIVQPATKRLPTFRASRYHG